jgi:hypothetical protein
VRVYQISIQIKKAVNLFQFKWNPPNISPKLFPSIIWPDIPFKENIRPYIGLTAKGLYKALFN